MNINRKLTLIAILAFVFSLFFVTATPASSNATSTVNDELPVKQIVPLLAKVKKSGHNKLTVEVAWTGSGEAEDEKAISRLRCHPKSAVTVKNSPQKHVIGDNSTTYELDVHKKNTHVNCKTGVIDIQQFKFTFSFRT